MINIDLVGITEAAAMLGWPTTKLQTYRQRSKPGRAGGFPKPVAELAAGPVWLKSQIEEYKASKKK